MSVWDPLEFLVGRWSSPVSGQPGEGIAGASDFSYALNGNILIRNSRAEFAPKPGETHGLVHDDLLIIYQQPEAPGLRAIYFDNEGHVIHYTLAFPEKQPGVIFESDERAAGPRARLTYEMDEHGMLITEFSVALPGGELVSHVKGRLRREPEQR